MIADQTRFDAAMARIDAANAEDPNTDEANGLTHPKELLYGKRMTAWLDRLAPNASEALRLAARAQHIRRWTMPRRDYPMTRAGYLKWRIALYRFHAETTANILRDVGYDSATISAVESLLRKESLRYDHDAQCLEDVVCLVFLENHLAEFATQHDQQKVLNILRKTWKKMTPTGQSAASQLALPCAVRALLDKALSGM